MFLDFRTAGDILTKVHIQVLDIILYICILVDRHRWSGN